MTKLVNRAKVVTATTGTGTITLGSAVSGFQTFADAGVANGDTVRYVIEDGNNWEIGTGVYTATGTTLSRTVSESSNAGAAINLSGSAVVYVSMSAAEMLQQADIGVSVQAYDANIVSDASYVHTDNNYTTTEKSKLAGIEAGATADQTAAEIKTAYESNANTNAFTDAEQTKLAGIETAADVTDAGNVNPLVDSHLNTSSATTGQYLGWNGADYAWSTVSGYTDADVDTHLNTGTATTGEVLSWTGSDYDWIAVSGGATSLDELSDAATTSNGIYLGQNTTPSGNSVTVGTLAATQQYSIHIGSEAGRNSSGSTQSNIGIGYRSLTGVSPAGDANNVAIGKNALGGYRSSADRASSSNIAVGGSTASSSTTGIRNVIVGDQAASYLTTGSSNTIIGNWAARLGGITTGSNNIVIGSGVNPSSATVSNEITLGNSSITTLRCQVTTITSLSDARDKTDIQPLNAGLEFVETLNPVSFTWNMRDGGKVGEADTGFIAQDLQAAQAKTGVSIPGLVYDVNPDKLEAGYGKLIPVLVQAIKDLSDKVKDLEARLEGK